MTYTTPGKIAVPTPGTPVALTTNAALTAHSIVVSQVPGTTGIVYLKNIKNAAAGVIVRAFLAPGASGFLDEHTLCADDLTNPLYPADWAIDAANTNEGLYVYWTTV